MNLGKNKKTTILGILTILGALIHAGLGYASGQPVDLLATFAAVSSGVGLITAKDSSTHSTAAEVQTATNQPKG